MVAGAAADVAGEHLAHLFLGGLRVLGEKLRRGNQNAGRAEAALQRVMAAECFLQVVELAVPAAQALDGLDPAAVDLHGIEETRPHGAAVEQDGAGTAYAVLASDMG